MPLYDFHCRACEHENTEVLTIEQYEKRLTELDDAACPLCGVIGTYQRVFRKAPFCRVGGEGSNRQLVSMKKSFKERFVKSGEMDQVRHKFGPDFDESVRSAAAQRIKNGQKPFDD